MTVSSSTDRATFPGNGVATVFPLPFRFFFNSEIQAGLLTNATGELTPLTLGTHYSLAGAGLPEVDGNAASVLTMLAAPSALQSLYVQRVIPVMQSTDIVNQGKFLPEIHENVFDRLTMLIQQNAGSLERALRVQDYDPVPSRLPGVQDRFDKLLSFDSFGNPVAVAAASQSATDLELRLANKISTSLGSELVGFIQDGTGAEGMPSRDKMKEHVSVLDFMTDAERADTLRSIPLLDHSAAFQNAINSVSNLAVSTNRGRRVNVPGGRRYRLAASITLRAGTTLSGEIEGLADNYSVQEPVVPSVIYLASGVTINCTIGNTTNYLTIMKEGLTFPQSQAQAAAWTGIALTMPNNACHVEKCVIIGFNMAISAQNHSRLSVTDCLIDCTNGVDNSGSFDVSYFTRVHCWPYSSIGGVTADFKRAGTAFRIHDVGDWAKFSDCFSYGYLNGFVVENANDVTLLNCSADNVAGHAGAIGFSVIGSSIGTRLIAPQAAAQETGILINQSTPAATCSIVNPNLWNNSVEGIRIDSATGIMVNGGTIRGSTYGVSVNNAGANGLIEGVRFLSTITADCIRYQTTCDNLRVTDCTLQSGGAGRLETNGKAVPQIASASSISLNQYFDVQSITGTTTIATISGATSVVGRSVQLHFIGVLTLTHSANLILKGGVSRATTAGEVIHFVQTASGVWREV